MPKELEWAREMGAQGADIDALKEQMGLLRNELSEMRKDMSAVREMLAKNQGGIRMILAVGSIAATLGASITEAIRYLHK